MMRAIAIAAVAAALAGCGTIPREVKVPVPVYCDVKKPAPPAWAASSLAPSADTYDQVKALLAERRQRIGYEGELEAAIDGCRPPER